MSRKLALIIGNSKFDDGNLAQLKTPSTDANALAEILRDPEIGGFDEVQALVNQPSTAIRRAISGFFVERERDDLLLLYFSGHGIRDDRGQLFLAVKDTEHNLLRGTAIPAAYITEEMDNSRSRRQVLILDCCHSGAFSHGMKGAPGISVGTAAAFEGTGSGRVVLTATDSTQYAWEGDQVIGQADNSVFTHYLIKGLRSGEADTDADGQITLDELYNYVYEQVVDKTPMQTPGKWSYRQQGEIVIARNPHPVVKRADLPADLQQTIDDPRPWVREGAVQELDRLLKGGHPGLALAALEAIERLANDDSRRVASMATQSLAVYAEAQGSQDIVWTGTPEKQREREQSESRMLQAAETERAASAKTTQVAQAPLKVEQPVGAITPAGVHLKLNWTPILLLIIGWAIAWGFGWILGESYGWEGTSYEIAWIIIGAIGGLITGLVLRQIERSINWKQILLITIGWGIGSIIGDAISMLFSGSTNTAISLFLFGAIGGLVTGLAWYWRDLVVFWKPILLITIGWTIGWTIHHYIGNYLYIAFSDTSSFLYQILPDSFFSGSIAVWAIPGAISMIIPVAIGSVVMLWQIGKLSIPPA